MTGPLVAVSILQPAGGTIVLPGQGVVCSGRATGHVGLQTTTVDGVTLTLDGGTNIEADLTAVLPKPPVPTVNWSVTVPAPMQAGPHQIKVTAFPSDGGAVATEAVGFVVQDPTPPPGALTPQASLELSVTNPEPPASGDWATAIVEGNGTPLDLTSVLDEVLKRVRHHEYPVCSREWNQVTAPLEDYDAETVGFSGWLLEPELSGADVPFTHPFGNDWECMVALDPQFAGLLAPGNVEPDGAEGSHAFDIADNELQIPQLLHFKNTQQMGGLLAVETDSRCVPFALRPPFGDIVRPGDRIAAIGRWIVDAAHAVDVKPGDSPQLPEGGTSFRSELHPPLLMAIGGTRALTPTDVRTRILVTSRPFLTRQVYVVDTDRIGDDSAPDDGTLLTHLHREIDKLSPGWWPPGIPDSLTIEAHPQIAARPFIGLHVAHLTVRPPPDVGHLAGPFFGEAQVSFQLTHRPGVGVRVVGTDVVVAGERQAGVEVQITLDGASYQPAPLMPRQEWVPSLDDLGDGAALIGVELAVALGNPSLDPITRIDQIQALARRIVTDAYDVPGVDLLDRTQAQPFVEVTQIPAGQGIVENGAEDQPYPIFGWLDIRWHRPDVVFVGGQ